MNETTIQNSQSEEKQFLKIYNILSSILYTNVIFSETENLCITYSLELNAKLISKIFSTPKRIKWLNNNEDKLKTLIETTLLDKDHFITENYKMLERRIEECIS